MSDENNPAQEPTNPRRAKFTRMVSGLMAQYDELMSLFEDAQAGAREVSILRRVLADTRAEVTRLGGLLQDGRPGGECCERDHDGDGDCDRHPARGGKKMFSARASAPSAAPGPAPVASPCPSIGFHGDLRDEEFLGLPSPPSDIGESANATLFQCMKCGGPMYAVEHPCPSGTVHAKSTTRSTSPAPVAFGGPPAGALGWVIVAPLHGAFDQAPWEMEWTVVPGRLGNPLRHKRPTRFETKQEAELGLRDWILELSELEEDNPEFYAHLKRTACVVPDYGWCKAVLKDASGYTAMSSPYRYCGKVDCQKHPAKAEEA